MVVVITIMAMIKKNERSKGMITYHLAKLEEIRTIARLHNELVYYVQKATKDIYWDFKEISEEDTSEYLKTFINHPERRIFVAKEGEQIIAFMVGEIVGCHLPISSIHRVGYIAAAYVLPTYRGQGIATQLENRLVGYFKEQNLKYVELHYIANNRVAEESWKKLGYQTFRKQARKEI